MKVNKSLENSIGLVLLATCLYQIIFNRPNWHEADGPIFYFPLFVGFALILKKEISFLILGVLSWLAYFADTTGIIEDHLFGFLMKHDLFPSFALEFGRANARYIVLILFIIVISILSILVFLKKSRSQIRVFSLISCCGTLAFTFVIHSAIPDTLIKWNRQLGVLIMEDALSTKSDSEEASKLPLICQTFHLRCSLFTDKTSALSMFQTEQLRSNIDGNISFMREQGIKRKVIEASEHRSGEFYRLIVGLVSHSANQYSVLVEDKWINQSQRLGEETIGKWGLVGHFVWGWLVIFLGVFHTSQIRNKIFNTPI